jgi:hypothetical protein
VDQFVGPGVQWQIAGLLAFAGDRQMRDAPPHVSKILDLELTQLLAAQRMIEQRRQDGAVALLLDGFIAGHGQKLASLMVTERRRLAFATLGPRPLDALDRVMGDGVFFAEIFEQ